MSDLIEMTSFKSVVFQDVGRRESGRVPNGWIKTDRCVFPTRTSRPWYAEVACGYRAGALLRRGCLSIPSAPPRSTGVPAFRARPKDDHPRGSPLLHSARSKTLGN